MPFACTASAVPVFDLGGRPSSGASEGQVLVRVKAAGVGPWDAWVRSGQSALRHELPLIPGSDLSGVIERAGPGVREVKEGEAIFGVTNEQFTGAYAEYAIASGTMIARKPERLGFVEAASVPVVACTAWQMVFEHGQADATKRVLIHGAAGNVGAYAVQFAKRAAKEVVATAFVADIDYVRALGADRVIDVQASPFEELLTDVDIVIDTVGGDTLDRSFRVLRRGGVLVSSVATPDAVAAERHGVRRGVLPGRRLVRPARRDHTLDRCWPAPNQRRRRPASPRREGCSRDAGRQTSQAREDRPIGGRP